MGGTLSPEWYEDLGPSAVLVANYRKVCLLNAQLLTSSKLPEPLSESLLLLHPLYVTLNLAGLPFLHLGTLRASFLGHHTGHIGPSLLSVETLEQRDEPGEGRDALRARIINYYSTSKKLQFFIYHYFFSSSIAEKLNELYFYLWTVFRSHLVVSELSGGRKVEFAR